MPPKNKKKAQNSDSDEDDTFYYRYGSTAPLTTTPKPKATSSHTLAPSKSTLYVSNIDYTLTNSDLHTLFSTFGKLARVTVLKDRVTRQSRGVAFIQYVTRNDAVKAAEQMNGKVLNGRTIKASIAADNGRAAEFIRKRVYKDKSRCYECGEGGHLSYECPRNRLGNRERPVEKKGRRGGGNRGGGGGGKWCGDEGDGDGDGESVFEEENWASVVDGGAEERLMNAGEDGGGRKRKERKAGYFSDESGEDD